MKLPVDLVPGADVCQIRPVSFYHYCLDFSHPRELGADSAAAFGGFVISGKADPGIAGNHCCF